jgi:mannose-6-phosphate isomerase-like protein (cupin superfamily)
MTISAVDIAAKPIIFNSRKPLLSAGQTTDLSAQTELMTVHTKVYSEGGENGLHAHSADDHMHYILQGEATFFFGDGSSKVVGQYEGVLLPKGCLYRFQSTGEGNLVLLRVAAKWDPYNGPQGDSRVHPDGAAFDSKSSANKTGAMAGVPIPGKFFGD